MAASTRRIAFVVRGGRLVPFFHRRTGAGGNPAGTITFASASYAAAEGDTVSVVVRRTGGSLGAVSADLAWGGTATNVDDYDRPVTTIAWEDGDDTPIVLAVPIADDAAEEGPETVTLTLSNPTGGATLGTASTTITIAASDAVVPDPLVAGTLSESSHDVDSVTLSWTDATGGVAPVVASLQYRISGSGTWLDSGEANSPATVVGLASATDYEFRVLWTDDASATVASNTVAVATDAESGEPAALLVFDAGDAWATSDAVTFEPGDYLDIPSNATLQGGDIALGFALWFRPTTLASNSDILSKWGSGNHEYILIYNASSGDYEFYASPDGTNAAMVAATSHSPGVGTWDFIECWHDPVADTINIRVNQGATASAAHATGIHGGSQPFCLGRNADGAAVMNGDLDAVVFFKPPGAIADVIDQIGAALYNSGLGAPYRTLATSQKADWGVVSYWPLSGPLAIVGEDLHGTNHLATTGTPVVSAPGAIRGGRRAWHGERIERSLAADGWIGEGVGPLRSTYRERLVVDADGPGVSQAGASLLGRTAWEAYIRVDDILGTPGTAYQEHGSDGSFVRIGYDSSGVLSVTQAGAGGAGSATISATKPMFGRASVVSGSAEDGTTETIRTLVLDGPIDVANGHLIDVAGAGVGFDGADWVVRTYDPQTYTLTYSMPYGGSAGLSGAAVATPGGTITPTGEYTWVATWWPGRKTGVMPAVVRVERDGDSVAFSYQEHSLGGGSSAGLPTGDAAGAVATVGARLGEAEDIPGELPGRIELYADALDATESRRALARLSVRFDDRDTYGGFALYSRFHSFPGIATADLHLYGFLHVDLDDATDEIAGEHHHNGDRDGIGGGTAPAQILGSDRQTTTKTYTRHLWAFARRWDTNGDEVPPTAADVHCVVELPTITRRPYDRERHLASGGSDSNDGRTSATAWATGAKAIANAGPGTVVRLAGTPTILFFSSSYAGPSMWAPLDDENPPTLIGEGWTATRINLAGCRAVAFRDLVIQHNSASGEGISHASPTGITLSGMVDTLGDGITASRFIVSTEAVNTYMAIHDCHAVGSATDVNGTYTDQQGATGVQISRRRNRYDRPIEGGAHVLRVIAPDGGELVGCTHDPVVADAVGAFAITYTIRWSPRDFYAADNDTGQVMLAFESAGADAVGAGVSHPALPMASNLVVERCEGKAVSIAGSSGTRLADCYAPADGTVQLIDEIKVADVQAFVAGSAVVVGNRAPGGNVYIGPARVLAAPTSGPWANVGANLGNTGGALTAPGLVDLTPGGKAGWLAFALDGSPRGGTGEIVTTLYVDDVAWVGAVRDRLALPAAPGEHTLRVDVTDQGGSGTTVQGTPLTVTVAGTDGGEGPPASPQPSLLDLTAPARPITLA